MLAHHACGCVCLSRLRLCLPVTPAVVLARHTRVCVGPSCLRLCLPVTPMVVLARHACGCVCPSHLRLCWLVMPAVVFACNTFLLLSRIVVIWYDYFLPVTILSLYAHVSVLGVAVYKNIYIHLYKTQFVYMNYGIGMVKMHKG